MVAATCEDWQLGGSMVEPLGIGGGMSDKEMVVEAAATHILGSGKGMLKGKIQSLELDSQPLVHFS